MAGFSDPFASNLVLIYLGFLVASREGILKVLRIILGTTTSEDYVKEFVRVQGKMGYLLVPEEATEQGPNTNFFSKLRPATAEEIQAWCGEYFAWARPSLKCARYMGRRPINGGLGMCFRDDGTGCNYIERTDGYLEWS